MGCNCKKKKQQPPPQVTVQIKESPQQVTVERQVEELVKKIEEITETLNEQK